MKKHLIITIILLLIIGTGFSQNNINSLRDTVKILQNNNFKLRKDFNYFKFNTSKKIDNLQNIVNIQAKKIDSLQKIIAINSENITQTADELGLKINETEENTNQKIQTVNKTISRNTLYWAIAILTILLLLIIVFIVLKKQIFKQKSDLVSDIEKTRKLLEEESVKLDNKLLEILEKQLNILENSTDNNEQNEEIDHSLALKVADEIVKIQKNLSRMDTKTKGLKQLKAAVKRIQDNFAANGYEIVDMLGKPYDERMKVTANFIPDEDLEPGQQIITRIIKPQVNYKGVMIQSAQIEVSIGE